MKLTADTILYGLPGTRYEGITAKVEFTLIRYIHLSYNRPVLYPSGITVCGEPMALTRLWMYFSPDPQESLLSLGVVPDGLMD